MKIRNYLLIILTTVAFCAFSCKKNDVASNQDVLVESFLKGDAPPPEYKYTENKKHSTYFKTLDPFWKESWKTKEDDWKSMHSYSIKLIKEYEEDESIPQTGKRSLLELISFKMLTVYLVKQNIQYANDQEKARAILFYLKKLKEYDSNNNSKKFQRILENIKKYVDEEDYMVLKSYYSIDS